MKNKIISAMLVGMSATMAVPVTAVMAAEGEQPDRKLFLSSVQKPRRP